ncbi:hypothetical protein CQW23_08139 [Capsicum baccatum]|uniref:Uncharacterized protein n=1 Tax=Capsicum baccatum TaxID=33114 RepID=A0A2G2X875_CAPBA|nr:hypothetical protein CQW23_08139 [Capsicum baccatum]
MIRRTATSSVQNFYPHMGQTAPSEVMIRWTSLSRVFSSVYIQPPAWQAAEDIINASRESSGQWQAAEDNINASGGSSEQLQLLRIIGYIWFFHLSTSSLRHGRLLRKIPMLAKGAVDSGRLPRTISMLVEGAVNNGRMLRIISLLAEGPVDISSRLAAEDNTNASRGSSAQGNVDG